MFLKDLVPNVVANLGLSDLCKMRAACKDFHEHIPKVILAQLKSTNKQAVLLPNKAFRLRCSLGLITAEIRLLPGPLHTLSMTLNGESYVASSKEPWLIARLFNPDNGMLLTGRAWISTLKVCDFPRGIPLTTLILTLEMGSQCPGRHTLGLVFERSHAAAALTRANDASS